MFIILARSSTIMGLTLEYSALNVYICQCSLLYNDAALAVSWIAQLTSFFWVRNSMAIVSAKIGSHKVKFACRISHHFVERRRRRRRQG